VGVAVPVDLVDHGGQGGRLAAAGRPGHQDQPAGLVAQGGDHGRQPQCFETLDFKRNQSKHGGDRTALVEDVAAKPGNVFHPEGKVQFQVFLQPVLLGVGEHAVGQAFCLGRGQRRQIERPEPTIDADLRRGSGGQVEVRPAEFLQFP